MIPDDAATMVRDPRRRALVAVMLDPFTEHDPQFATFIVLDGWVWDITCGHRHKTRHNADRCVRPTARRWSELAAADTVRVVNGGQTLEWATPRRGVRLGWFKRANAAPLEPGMVLVDSVQPVSGLVPGYRVSG
jgi:hypothetical protein